MKKWMAQGHELDKEHLKSELGDIAWYLAEAATALDISLEEVFQANIDKLKKRYPKGFDAGIVLLVIGVFVIIRNYKKK